MDCAGDVEPVRSMGGKYSSRGDMLPDAQAGGEPLGRPVEVAGDASNGM